MYWGSMLPKNPLLVGVFLDCTHEYFHFPRDVGETFFWASFQARILTPPVVSRSSFYFRIILSKCQLLGLFRFLFLSYQEILGFVRVNTNPLLFVPHFQQRPPEQALNSKAVRSQQSSCFAKNCPSVWLVWKGTHDKGILLWQWCLSMQKSVTLSIIPAITWFRLFAKIICLLSLFSSQDLWKLKQILSTLSLTVRTSLQIRRIAGMGDLLTEDFSLGKTTLKEVRSVDLFRIFLGC